MPFGAPPAPPPQVNDPHGVGLAVGRLGSGGRRSGRVAFAVLAALLGEGDVVDVVVQGRFRGGPGVAALVGARVFVVNDRPWKPDVVVMPVGPDLQVQGWQDERTASLRFITPSGHELVDRIGDRVLAIELAQRVRDRTAQAQSGDQPG